jgi:hypothetical protein
MATPRRFERIVQKSATILILVISAGAAYTLWRGANPWTVATIWLVLGALSALCGTRLPSPRASDRK